MRHSEITYATDLPQADATTLVDRADLERQVQEVYRGVARNPLAPRHFETGRSLALRLGYPEPLLASVPAPALASFAGVGYHLDLAALRPGDRVLDLGSGSGTDAFCAGASVGDTGRVVGVDFTDAQVARATSHGERGGIVNVRFVEASIDRLPFDDSDRARDACQTYGVESTSIAATRKTSLAARLRLDRYVPA